MSKICQELSSPRNAARKLEKENTLQGIKTAVLCFFCLYLFSGISKGKNTVIVTVQRIRYGSAFFFG